MARPEDPGILSVLTAFGVADHEPLGWGGEAWVYALGDNRVLRVLHGGGRAEDIGTRQQLVDGLRQARPPFALPQVLEVGEIGGRVFALERRLPGRSVLDTLDSARGDQRRQLVESYLDTTAVLGDLHLESR